MTARMWHPEIAADPLAGEGFAEVDDSAVAQLRQSGWLLASERDEHLARVAAHPSQQPRDDEGKGDEGKAEGSRSRRGASNAGSSGSEGS